MTAFVATARDKQLLQWMLSNLRNQRQNVPLRDVPDVQDSAPDVYIARLGTSGTGSTDESLPALQRDYVEGVGTGSGPGPGIEDSPGYALCDLYRIIHNNGTPRFQKVRSQERIYNIAPDVVVAEWFLVARTKFGEWVRLGTAAGRTEYAILDQEISDGAQPAGTTATITMGPANSNIETGETAAIDWAHVGGGGTASAGATVVLEWKWGKVYAVPVSCPGSTGTGTGTGTGT